MDIETTDTEPLSSQVGAIVADKYELLGELGSGGMGSVFKARHVKLPKFFAIKILKRTLSHDPNFRLRFEQEAKTSSLLNHPHLVSISNFGATEYGELFLVMEYIDGRSLADSLSTIKRMEQKEAIEVFAQICQGMQHAHKLGIIHRDLKPSNIMLANTKDNKPFVKIVDFGIAKMAATDGAVTQSLTKTGQFFGSPLYISPEQADGKKIDHRTDIYSLGILMYECLTSAPPFRGENAFATMTMHIQAQPKPFLKSLGLGQELEHIVFKALEKNADDRFQSMESLREALLSVPAAEDLVWAQDASPKTVPIPAPVAAPRQGKSSMLPALCFMVLALALAGGTSWFIYRQLHPQVSAAPAAKIVTGPDAAATAFERSHTSSVDLPAILGVQLPEQDQNLSSQELVNVGQTLKGHPAPGSPSLLPAKYFTAAVEADTNNSEAYQNLCDCYWTEAAASSGTIKHDWLRKCLSVYNQYVSHRPKQYEAYSNRASVEDALEMHDEALADIDRALKLNDTRTMQLKRGYFLKGKRRFREAIAQFDKYIEPDDDSNIYVEAMCYQSLGDDKQCIAFCTKWIKKGKQIGGVYRVRADCERSLQQYGLALKDYELVAKLAPEQYQQRAEWIEDCRREVAEQKGH